MGFRNPIRTAAAVDTRDGDASAAGVTVDGATATWHDGFGTAGRVELTSPPGGGTGGAGFSVIGSDRFATRVLGRLDLQEKELPAGGYESVATMRAERIELLGAVSGGDAWQALPMGSTAWTPWDTTANLPRARRNAAGDIHLSGIVKLASGASFAAGGTSIAAILPAGYEPLGASLQRSIFMLNSNGTYGIASWLFIGAGSRNVVVVNTSGASQTAGVGWVIGASYSPVRP